MIGDNLSSHINEEVLRSCSQHNIIFICVPPNSTHLTQPLDVAFFRSMKAKWRSLLTNWKRRESSKKSSVMPKDVFPRQLRELHSAMEKVAEQNLKSGFRKAGIYPQEKEELLKRLPKRKANDSSLVCETFLDVLQEIRSSSCSEPRQKRKVNVEPGKSVTADKLENDRKENESTTIDESSDEDGETEDEDQQTDG